MKTPTIEDIDALLPQTQCGLCAYDGCKPYAEAMLNANEEINRCPPGGTSVLKKLGNLFNIDPTSYIDDMLAKQKSLQTVVIIEEKCIGCTKCIQVCPVDAIMGAAKMMHSVIQAECTGCELCIPACPVDCIDILKLGNYSEETSLQKAPQYRQRFEFRQKRLLSETTDKQVKFEKAKQSDITLSGVDARKREIQAAIARVKAKRSQRHEQSDSTKNI